MAVRVTRKVQVLLGGAVASLLVAGVGAIWLQAGSTAVSVDTALQRWRAVPVTTTTTSVPPSSVPAAPAAAPAQAAPAVAEVPAPAGGAAPAPAAAAPAEPEQGVYVQSTEGGEETDALGGARHDYPPETAFTVSATDCGLTFRWQPLEERWDEWELCRTPAGFEARRFSTFHSFFRRSQQQDFACTGAVLVPSDRTVGRSWSWSCANDAGSATSQSTIVGVEPVDVGGAVVDAVHVRFANTFEGANSGTGTIDWWLHPSTGLPVRMAAELDTDSDSPFGRVAYRERFTSTVTSLSPRR